MDGKHWRAALACCLLCAGMAACSGPAEGSSSEMPAPTAAIATAAPTRLPATPTAAPTPSPVAVPTASPTPEGKFDEAFETGNPITEQLQEDLGMAASPSAIVRAYTDATHHWQSLIGIAYYDALAVLPDEEAASLEAEQAQWESEIQGKIEAIQAQAAQDYPGDETGSTTGEGQIWAASEICALYKERAQALCQAKFEADGIMPDFSDAMPNTEAMG